MTAALLVFAVTYLFISVQRIHVFHLNRPSASLLGAVAMVVVAGLPLEEAYRAIDLDVLVFLLGVMLLVAYLEEGDSSRRPRPGSCRGCGRPGSCWWW